jgi:hypothetical protein
MTKKPKPAPPAPDAYRQALRRRILLAAELSRVDTVLRAGFAEHGPLVYQADGDEKPCGYVYKRRSKYLTAKRELLAEVLEARMQSSPEYMRDALKYLLDSIRKDSMGSFMHGLPDGPEIRDELAALDAEGDEGLRYEYGDWSVGFAASPPTPGKQETPDEAEE